MPTASGSDPPFFYSAVDRPTDKFLRVIVTGQIYQTDLVFDV